MADYRKSDEELEKERRRRALLRQQKRKAQVRRQRLILLIVAVVAVFLIIFGFSSAIKESKKISGAPETTVAAESKDSTDDAADAAESTDSTDDAADAADSTTDSTENAGETEESTAAEGAVTVADALHLSFPMLLADETLYDGSQLTISQFQEILQNLYDSGYVLTDIYDLRKGVTLPAGKKPLIISERDVSYPLDHIGCGYASRLVLDADGNITCEYKDSEGNVTTGAYDVVPILEAFISEHPDFSYQDARGILGLTGYNGILGYRTTDTLAKTTEEGNAYAQFGTFDTASEISAAKTILSALEKKGWHMACNSNSFTSYGSEETLLEEDVENWKANVGEIIGDTDLLIYPCQTDIANGSDYSEDNEKYAYLKDQGFTYYFIENDNQLLWCQERTDYVRQGIHEIETYDDFTAVQSLS